MSVEFLGNIILKGKMVCLTGLHIGGSKEKFEIGGVDAPVIRDPWTNYPYIPGSSLKGKMRALLAYKEGKADKDPPKKENFDPNCPIQRVFGIPGDFVSDKNLEKAIGPTRLIVRDAHPDAKTIEMWESLDSELLYTEYKPENSINRLTSAANPRFLERVVKDSVFNVEFIFGVYKINKVIDAHYFKYVIESLRLLEHSALGGSGSRGYGQVEFKFIKPLVVKREDYISGKDNFKDAIKKLDDLLAEKSEELEWHKRLSDFDENKIKEITEQFPQS